MRLYLIIFTLVFALLLYHLYKQAAVQDEVDNE